MNSRFDKAMDIEISEQELLQMEMVGGGKVQDLIDKYPGNDKVKYGVISGAYRCLKVGWPLHELNIAVASREVAREELQRQGIKISG